MTIGTTNGAVRVLIVDDSRDAVMLLGILLRSEGYDVRLAHGGEEALSQAAEFRPHVVLLDLQMPDRDGFEVAQELTRRFSDDCPVLIAVTASSDEADRRHADTSGFHQFVTKPYKHQSMLQLIKSLHA